MQTGYRILLSALFCSALILASTPIDSGAAALFQTRRSSDYAGQGMPLTTQELQSLVAPIALYPDPIVGQILTGATYPDQVAAADDFVQHKGLSGHALMDAVALQPWDPSVKALTEFPTVLNMMAQNLAWTSQVGESYHNQQAELMTAIQALRAKAVNAGNLKSGPQLRVNQPTPDIVALQPANPQVLYLPLYNPAVVYGTHIDTPNFTSSDTANSGEITFGGGVAAGALTAGGCCDWGAANWGCNWYHGVAYFHDYPYNGNNAWHGSYYGGYNYYGNHTYHTSYDYSHPYTAFQGAGSQGRTAAGRETGKANSFDMVSGGWSTIQDVRGWGMNDAGDAVTVFSSWDKRAAANHFAVAGWGDRAASFRGWVTHGGSGGGWGTGGRNEGAH
jgi:hypothetical protein